MGGITAGHDRAGLSRALGNIESWVANHPELGVMYLGSGISDAQKGYGCGTLRRLALMTLLLVVRALRGRRRRWNRRRRSGIASRHASRGARTGYVEVGQRIAGANRHGLFTVCVGG